MSANSFWLAAKRAASSSSPKLPTECLQKLDSDGRYGSAHHNLQLL
jgi:hypothetical protein